MLSSYNFDQFGEKLMEIRKSRLMSRDFVSEKTGINRDTLRKIEKGIVIPRYETLEILSSFYKRNLLLMINDLKTEPYLSELCISFDECIVNFDKNKIRSLYDDFQKVKTNAFHLVNYTEFKQLKTLLDTIYDIYVNESTDFELHLDTMINAIKLSIEKFDINSKTYYKVNFIEFRIIFCICTLLRRTNKVDKCIDILLNLLKESDNVYALDRYIPYKIKIYYALSYSYFIKKDYSNSKIYAKQGVSLCLQKKSMELLPSLLFRLAVAQKILGETNFDENFKKAIDLLYIQENVDLANIFEKQAKKYGFHYNK